jgi:hypothetical protein
MQISSLLSSDCNIKCNHWSGEKESSFKLIPAAVACQATTILFFKGTLSRLFSYCMDVLWRRDELSPRTLPAMILLILNILLTEVVLCPHKARSRFQRSSHFLLLLPVIPLPIFKQTLPRLFALLDSLWRRDNIL